jgi:TP901 family phage tail tape measure protein
MANLSRSIDILFNGKETVSKSVGRVQRTIKALNQTVKDINEPLRKATKYLLEMEAASATLAAVMGGYALKAFSNYQFAVVDLNKVLSDTEKEYLPAVEDGVKKLARTYGESSVELIKNTTDFKKASFTIQESALLLENALKLSSAANTDMGGTTERLVQILKGFNYTADKSTHIIDVINILSDKYAVKADQLGDALAKVAPLADLAGFSFEELAAVLVPTIEVFQDSGEAATAWRRATAKVLDNSDPVIKALEDLKVKQKNANGELREASDIIFDIAKAFEGASKSNQIFIASEIFGNRQTAKLLASLRDLDRITEIVNVALGVEHSYTIDQVSKRWATLKVRVDAANETFEQAKQELGERLEPAAIKVVNALNALFEAFRSNLAGDAFKPAFKLIDDLGSQLSAYIEEIGKALPDILAGLDYGKFLAGFEDLKGEIIGIFQDLEITTPEGVKKFLQDFIDISGNALSYTAGLAEGLSRLYESAKPFLVLFRDMDNSSAQFFGRMKVWLEVLDKFGVVWGPILVSLGYAVGGMKKLHAALGEAFKEIEHSVGDLASNTPAKIGEMVDGFADQAARAENVFKLLDIDGEIKKMVDDSVTEAGRLGSLFDELDMESEIRRINEGLDAGAWKEYKNEAIGEVTEVVSRLKTEGEFVKSFNDQVIGSVVDTIQSTSGKTAAFLGKFSDDQLAAFEKADAAGTRLSQKIAASYKPIEEVEPPADEKFKAAQALLREEVNANAEIMKAQYGTVATGIEADSERIVAAMETTSAAFETSSSTLTSLYDTLATQDLDVGTKSAISRQISEEEKRQEEAFELQKQLTEAQINLLAKRAQALESGDALVTVSGDGLAPHLEAFMWEILSAVQVKASESYNSFLLGLS